MLSSTTSFWHDIATRGVSAMLGELSDSQAIEMTERYGAHNYHPLPVNIVRGEGCRVFDGAGKEYIDCVGAYSAVAHGHLNPAVVAAVKGQLDKLALTSRAVTTSEMALFLKALTEFCELDMACPMNTGAEAIETCIKLARKWGYVRKGVASDRAEIIVCEGNFHGRTTTIVGFSSEPRYRAGFGPFTPGFKVIPFGDAAALEGAIGPDTVAFLAEPIQAESGVIVPPDGFLSEARRICTKHNVLLIWDEVQTGFCRTGRAFGWMHENAKPDLVAVGKALGGGVLPISAAVGTKDVMTVFGPGDHGSTFGGNPLACVTALVAMSEMVIHNYSERAQLLGAMLTEGFKRTCDSRVREVRGKGLLIGVEFDVSCDSAGLQNAFLHHGLLTKETRSHTFRFAPPIIIDEATVEEVVARFRSSLNEAP